MANTLTSLAVVSTVTTWMTSIVFQPTTTSLSPTITAAVASPAYISPFDPIIVIPIAPDEYLASSESIQAYTTTNSLTVTETQTVTVSISQAPSSPPLRATSTLAPAPISSNSWISPAQIDDDLTSFNVSKFSSGRSNLEVITGVPPAFSAASFESDPDDNDAAPLWVGDASTIQVLYPASSISPSHRPQGGAQFYAHPLDLSSATSVSLAYSVFFPLDFDFVLGGKLPGLYGGRPGCSGGDAAEDCFSTRLMWRQHGAGELYLYAPRSLQSAELCDDEGSVCDATYGVSVGRGSFAFKRGRWTTVKQEVRLNAPGRRNGIFSLEVDGKKVIEREDIGYRRVPEREVHTVTAGKGHGHGGLGGILGPLLSDLLRREETGVPQIATATTSGDGRSAVYQAYYTQQREWMIESTSLPYGGPSDYTTAAAAPQPTEPPPSFLADDDDPQKKTIVVETDGKAVGFRGIFFSTFFGGHDERYATPKDQYVWFKDFAMDINE